MQVTVECTSVKCEPNREENASFVVLTVDDVTTLGKTQVYYQLSGMCEECETVYTCMLDLN